LGEKCTDYKVEGVRPRDKPEKTWRVCGKILSDLTARQWGYCGPCRRRKLLKILYYTPIDVDVDGVCERRPKPLCPHLEITSR